MRGSHRKASAKTRQEVRRRAGNRCQECGSEDHLTVHHIIPRSLAPELADDPNNCTLLCWDPCHLSKHQRAK
jgi:5-methylcytosine-specific restriction endonuclease McrA